MRSDTESGGYGGWTVSFRLGLLSSPAPLALFTRSPSVPFTLLRLTSFTSRVERVVSDRSVA